ncbi:MAG TPA: transporter substrate-binding domain-containing protein [Opitutaceae bacterium]|nr:transporter substrate-binding domain-containing protein [Opitutaceae bacterium]
MGKSRLLPPRLTGACLVGLLALASAQAEPAPAAPPAPVLLVGASSNTYPYSFIDEHGKLQGFAVDILDAVARVMGVRLRRESMPGRDLQARFLAGEFDLLQSYARTESRESAGDFSVPFLTLEGCIFVKKGGPVHQLEDFQGRPFAIIGRGSAGESFLADQKIRAKVVNATSAEEALQLVRSGACAGTFISGLTALAVMDHSRIADVAMLGDPMPSYEIRQSFAVHKGDSQLLDKLNEGLAIINRSGEYDKIYHKWFSRVDSPLFTRQQLIVYALTALLLALAAAVAVIFWQRKLRKRIARQAEELARQRALLQALYDHIPVGMSVVELTPAGPRLLSMNREAGKLYGIEPEKAVDALLGELPVVPAHRAHLADLVGRIPADDRLVHYEHPLESSRRVLEVTIVPLPGAGAARRFCVLTEDISARKLLDAEVAQSRKLRAVGELVGGIAHEFNNLLTPMMLKVGEIQMDWADDAKLQQEIVVIAQATQRAAELTRRLLTFGRKSDARADSVSLAEQIVSCFELLRPAMDRRIIWDSDVPGQLATLNFNATELNQILINLLLNARDTLMEKLALPHDDSWVPHIRVSVAELPAGAAACAKPRPGQTLAGWQRLTVSDNGLGMPVQVLERMFEPFFTTKEVGKGTGLGLATVWHLVVEAGGRVEADSKPGLGTTFHVYLPIWPSNEQAAPVPEAVRTQAPATASVLLIEDEPLVAQTVTAILRRGGHGVRHIADGGEAWRHLSEDLRSYNLLVVDVNLPGLNGVDLVSRVRERNFPGRILVVSGRVAMTDLRALVQLQVDRVLTKPFTPLQFETALRECLA